MAVGAVGADRALVWVRAPGPGPVAVEVEVSGGSGPAGPAAVRATAEATVEADLTVRLPVAGLAPRTRHRYRVTAAGGEEASGEFATAPRPDDPAPLVLAWSGDLGGGNRCRHPVDGYPVFRALLARRPDLFVFAGDTMYADHRCSIRDNVPGADFVALDLAGFRRKHRYNRADPAVQAFFRAVPVEATWDDHDVANDFAGPGEPLMPEGRRAFLDYWPVAPPPEEAGRLYRAVRWGRLLELFILDTRQYRSANAAPDGPAKTMLGAAQRAWLVEGLTASDARWRVVVSSVPLSLPTGRGARDSWARLDLPFRGRGGGSGFEHELGQIVRALAARGVRHVVWLTADVHHPEVLRHEPAPGLVFHELAAGPLRAGPGGPGPLSPTLRPVRLWADGGYDGFGELVLEPEALSVRMVDAGGRIRFEARLDGAR